MGRTGALLCLTVLLATFPATSSPQGAGEAIVTNYGVLERIAAEAVDELMDNMPSIAQGTLILLTKEKGIGAGIDKIFENVLITRMTDAGMRVSVKAPESDAAQRPGFELSYQIIGFNLKYPGIGRSYWIGAKEVERLATIGIFAKLVESGPGEIVWVGDTQKKYEDRIAYSLLDRVEDPQHDFTRPPRNEVSWSRIIEPVVVGGIVVGLVYLFFANQDNN
ncbi:MAG: hypothetical protein PHQ19_06625 [Candidatus Krumholzibacteria bacterium]|nr:hypothetical protein [Candidatus Krumholzibacteria bacterium]